MVKRLPARKTRKMVYLLLQGVSVHFLGISNYAKQIFVIEGTKKVTRRMYFREVYKFNHLLCNSQYVS